MLYGTTTVGGSAAAGTAFSINLDGTGYTVLRPFDGTTDGGFIFGGLLEGLDGALYGTAFNGGAHSGGTIFRLTKDGSSFTVLRGLDIGADPTDGSQPAAGLIQGSDGKLYGTTEGDGSTTLGTVFRLDPDGNNFQVVRNFTSGADGRTLAGGVIEGSDHYLYGTAYTGGAGDGTVFKMQLDGTDFQVLHSFNSVTEGGALLANVIEASDGRIYGTTYNGGLAGYGTVYRLDKDGSQFDVLASFDSVGTGGFLWSGVTEGPDGYLYGAASLGGTYGSGTIYKVKKDGTGFAIVREMGAAPGEPADLRSPLIFGSNHLLYGTSNAGGDSGSGTLFALDLGTVTSTDTLAPLLTIPANAIVDCGASTAPAQTGTATATDDSGVAPSISYSDSVAAGTGTQVSIITRTWTATDGSLNSTSRAQLITVVDVLPPTPNLTSLPTLTAQCQVALPAPPTATDTCDGNITATTDAPAQFGQGDYTIVWTYTDSRGNRTTQNQSISVHDTTPPTIGAAPANLTVNASGPSGAPVSFTPPTASDNCAVTVNCAPAPGNTFPIGTTTVVCTATDTGGNIATTSFTITVKGARDQVVDLGALIRGLALSRDTKSNLTEFTDNALRDLDRNRASKACQDLSDLISKVNDLLHDRKLTTAQATQLTAEATRIRNVIGCASASPRY